MPAPILLNDEQIRKFICDGYLILQPSVDPSIHDLIDEKFCWLAANEPNPGNNILARLPELTHILESPEVTGAMISLLGDDYITCTHCFWHGRKPNENEISDEDARAEVERGSHQDNYCPSAIGKSHNLQYIRFMYYSHDMTMTHGPTHVTPGSQYNASVFDEDRKGEIPVLGQKGTVFISHFDVVHAGCPNRSDRVRNMIKFLFTRRTIQTRPHWDKQASEWQEPAERLAPYSFANCWKSQWHFLAGNAPIANSHDDKAFSEPDSSLSTSELVDFIESIGANPAALDYLLGLLNTAEQPVRISAIYALARLGEEAIEPLINYLSKIEKPEKVSLRMPNNTVSFDDATQALIAIGPDVADRLTPLLQSGDIWVASNALHILNILCAGNDKTCDEVLALMKNENDFVVGMAINALSSIGSEKHIPELLKIFDERYDIENHDAKVADTNVLNWPHEWIIHFNAALALNRLAAQAEKYEDEIAARLGHPFAQVDLMLIDCLRAIGSKSALEKAIAYSRPRIWDHSLRKGRTF